MAQSAISFFKDDTAVSAMETRVPDAVSNSGVEAGGSNAPGIGISTENPGLDESLPNWTLENQFGQPRNPQTSQHIGGSGITQTSDWPGSGGAEGIEPEAPIRLATEDSLPTYSEKLADGEVDGAVQGATPNASLSDLADGWESAAGNSFLKILT